MASAHRFVARVQVLLPKTREERLEAKQLLSYVSAHAGDFTLSGAPTSLPGLATRQRTSNAVLWYSISGTTGGYPDQSIRQLSEQFPSLIFNVYWWNIDKGMSSQTGRYQAAKLVAGADSFQAGKKIQGAQLSTTRKVAMIRAHFDNKAILALKRGEKRGGGRNLGGRLAGAGRITGTTGGAGRITGTTGGAGKEEKKPLKRPRSPEKAALVRGQYAGRPEDVIPLSLDSEGVSKSRADAADDGKAGEPAEEPAAADRRRTKARLLPPEKKDMFTLKLRVDGRLLGSWEFSRQKAINASEFLAAYLEQEPDQKEIEIQNGTPEVLERIAEWIDRHGDPAEHPPARPIPVDEPLKTTYLPVLMDDWDVQWLKMGRRAPASAPAAAAPAEVKRRSPPRASASAAAAPAAPAAPAPGPEPLDTDLKLLMGVLLVANYLDMSERSRIAYKPPPLPAAAAAAAAAGEEPAPAGPIKMRNDCVFYCMVKFASLIKDKTADEIRALFASAA